MAPSVDIFCRVIDNLGDIGVSWRLARQLQSEKGCKVRLWVDHLASLQKLEPSVRDDLICQTCESIEVCLWYEPYTATPLDAGLPDIVIAAFSCDLPDIYLQRMAANPQATLWFQLEYLSAEPWVDGFHLQTSQREDGLKPIFFFPGFTPKTAGLIRERNLDRAHDRWCETRSISRQWLGSIGVPSASLEHARLISVFNYPSAPLEQFVRSLEQLEQPSLLLVPDGVETQLQQLDPSNFKKVRWHHIAFTRQPDFDRLLWSMDLNLVRGEDSFVRAIWAAKPFIWHIYPQDGQVHHQKLQAWLQIAGLPSAVSQAMHEWSDGQLGSDWAKILIDPLWTQWQQASLAHRACALKQQDLASSMIQRFALHQQEIQTRRDSTS